jgi:hypothetical protein
LSDPTPPPLSGIARATRRDKGVARKSTFDAFVDLYRRMSPSEQATALEVLRQISRIGAPQLKEVEDANDAG